jgi:hypothetical protein
MKKVINFGTQRVVRKRRLMRGVIEVKTPQERWVMR